eukprot:TRINITY_DN21567_c0_g1_i1.p1 TRINITY_DN21567_c0_g1~~TRINITY_DN21567_c0_g1_i1.p1  ORF type:complete len:284 (+),score=38.85 TRINITY_DN21567_c0_g1_i1:56-907(+)
MPVMTVPEDQELYPCKPVRSPEAQYQKELNMTIEEPVAASDMAQAEHAKMLCGVFWREFISAMHEGKLPEFFNKWLTDDIEWVCKRGKLFSVGIDNCILAYNRALVEFFGGPNSLVTFTLHEVDILSKDRSRLTACSKVDSPGPADPAPVEMQTLYEHLHVRFRGDRVCEILIFPVDFKLTPPPSPPLVSQKPKIELPPPSISRPCRHNNWDSVRIKNQIALLRCRICTSQWKIKVAQIKRCNRFTEGDCSRENCVFLHINMRKQTRAELEQRLYSDMTPCSS